MKRVTILVVALFIFFGGGCSPKADLSNSKSIINKSEVDASENVSEKNMEKALETVQQTAISEGLTYGDMLDNRFFEHSEWTVVVKTSPGNNEKYYSVSFEYSDYYTSLSVEMDSNLIKVDPPVVYTFYCAADYSEVYVLEVFMDGENKGEEYKRIIAGNSSANEPEEYLKHIIYNIASIMWYDSDEGSTIGNDFEDINQSPISTAQDQTDYNSESNNDFSDFYCCPFSQEDLVGAQKMEGWYDDGIFSSYVSLAYPNQAWEYIGTTAGVLDPNPYSYYGYDVYKVDNFYQYLWFVVPCSEFVAVPEVYAYDMASNTMKLVWSDGDFLE